LSIFASKNKAVCREVLTEFGSFLCANYIRKFMAHYLDFCVQKWAVCCWVQMHFGSFRLM